jgi:hypothetical protein
MREVIVFCCIPSRVPCLQEGLLLARRQSAVTDFHRNVHQHRKINQIREAGRRVRALDHDHISRLAFNEIRSYAVSAVGILGGEVECLPPGRPTGKQGFKHIRAKPFPVYCVGGLGLGSSQLQAYARNQSAANDVALDASAISEPIRRVAAEEGEEGFLGTASELLKAISVKADDTTRNQKDWQLSGQTLSNNLRRLVPNLRRVGVEVIFGIRSKDRARRRLIVVREVSAASTASAGS